jgi:hypothetical protein
MSVSYQLRQKCETHKFFSSGVSMIDGGCGSKEHAGSYHSRNVGEVTGRVIYRRRQSIWLRTKHSRPIPSIHLPNACGHSVRASDTVCRME